MGTDDDVTDSIQAGLTRGHPTITADHVLFPGAINKGGAHILIVIGNSSAYIRDGQVPRQ